jgi:hypothetical protein
MMRSPACRDAGNVFFIIFLAIALFGGLSWAVFRGGSTTQGTLSAEQARLAAQEIIATADNLATTVQKLRLRGCTDLNISNLDPSRFPAPLNTNASTPTDGSCSIFQTSGGAASPPVYSSTWHKDDNTSYYGWFFNGRNNISGLGSASAEYGIQIYNLKEPICTAINTILGVTNASTAPPVFGFRDASGFNGTYDTPPYDIFHTSLVGKSAFCLQDTGQYTFFRVLIVR